jgi:hypothetical protein
MLFHHLSQYLIFLAQSALQRGDLLLPLFFLLGLLGLKGGGPVFEKSLLPSIELGGMKAIFITPVRYGHSIQKVAV